MGQNKQTNKERRNQNFVRVQNQKAIAETPRFKSLCGLWKRVKHIPHFLVIFLVTMASPQDAATIVSWKYSLYISYSKWVFISCVQNRPDQCNISPTLHSTFSALGRKIFALFSRPAPFIILLLVFPVILLILSYHCKTLLCTPTPSLSLAVKL